METKYKKEGGRLKTFYSPVILFFKFLRSLSKLSKLPFYYYFFGHKTAPAGGGGCRNGKYLGSRWREGMRRGTVKKQKGGETSKDPSPIKVKGQGNPDGNTYKAHLPVRALLTHKTLADTRSHTDLSKQIITLLII